MTVLKIFSLKTDLSRYLYRHPGGLPIIILYWLDQSIFPKGIKRIRRTAMFNDFSVYDFIDINAGNLNYFVCRSYSNELAFMSTSHNKDLQRNNLHILLVFSSDSTAQKSITQPAMLMIFELHSRMKILRNLHNLFCNSS